MSGLGKGNGLSFSVRVRQSRDIRRANRRSGGRPLAQLPPGDLAQQSEGPLEVRWALAPATEQVAKFAGLLAQLGIVYRGKLFFQIHNSLGPVEKALAAGPVGLPFYTPSRRSSCNRSRMSNGSSSMLAVMLSTVPYCMGTLLVFAKLPVGLECLRLNIFGSSRALGVAIILEESVTASLVVDRLTK